MALKSIAYSYVATAAVFLSSLASPVFAAEDLKGATKTPAELVSEAAVLLDSWNPGQRGILIEAQKRLAEALKRDPKFAPAYAESARFLMKAGFDGTERMLKAGIQADPKYAKNYTLLGYFYTMTGNLPAAKDALEKADAIGTTDPWQPLNWAGYWKSMGDHPKALTFCQRVLDIGIQEKNPLVEALRCVNDYYSTVAPDRAKADSAFFRMAKLDPENAYYRGNYARHLILHFQDFDAGEKLARETLRVMDYPHARQTLSLALYSRWAWAAKEKKDKATVDALFAKAQKEDPDGSMIPGCALGYPSMRFLFKALEAKAKETQQAYAPLRNC